jgi:hypothetical protein
MRISENMLFLFSKMSVVSGSWGGGGLPYSNPAKSSVSNRIRYPRGGLTCGKPPQVEGFALLRGEPLPSLVPLTVGATLPKRRKLFFCPKLRQNRLSKASVMVFFFLIYFLSATMR